MLGKNLKFFKNLHFFFTKKAINIFYIDFTLFNFLRIFGMNIKVLIKENAFTKIN